MSQAVQTGPLPPGWEREQFLEGQPTYWLKRCYRALRRRVDQELRGYGLTLSQRDVLLTLYEEGPLDQGQLRDRLGLEQSSVSRLTDGLAHRRLIEVEAAKDDRRIRIASLTNEGEKLLLHSPGSSAIGGSLMVAGLSQADREKLLSLLRHCASNLSKDSGDKEPALMSRPSQDAARRRRHGKANS